MSSRLKMLLAFLLMMIGMSSQVGTEVTAGDPPIKWILHTDHIIGGNQYALFSLPNSNAADISAS